MKYLSILIGVSAAKNACSDPEIKPGANGQASHSKSGSSKDCCPDQPNKGCQSGLRCMKFESSFTADEFVTEKEMKIDPKDGDYADKKKKYDNAKK